MFEGLDETLTELRLTDNDLQTIAAGVFDPLVGLTLMSLNENDLSSLPPRIFEKLTKLTQLDLADNSGSADFVPIAKAGPEGGIDDVPQDATGVTLGGDGAAAGYDDPWGSNVEHAWTHVPASTTVTYDAGKGADTANPSFTAPSADGTLSFTLTVTGKGAATSGSVNFHRATSTVSVHVGITPGMEPMPESAVGERRETDADLQREAPGDRPCRGPGLEQGPGLSRGGERTGGSAQHQAGASERGRGQRKAGDPDPRSAGGLRGDGDALLFPEQRHGAEPGSATWAATSPTAFTGLRVRNDTPEGAIIENIAVTGEGKAHKISDTVGIEVTFLGSGDRGRDGWCAHRGAGDWRRLAQSEPMSGVPTASSSPSNTRVAETAGEEDTNGIAVEANGLAVPAGSSIVAVSDSRAAILSHARYPFGMHKVDGVRPIPTTDPAVSEGPGVSIAWTEPLDAGAVPAGAGGFTVNVPGVANPVVTAITISGSTVGLTLNAAIALGTTGVTVNYIPTATPIRDAAGNPALEFPNPLAVTVAVDMTAPKLTAATVDGATLRLVYNEALKVTSPEVAAYMAGVSGGSPFALSDVRAGVGPGNTQVTMTLDPPAQAGQTMAVAYTSTNATVATRVQDLAGNAAAGFVNPADLDPPITLGEHHWRADDRAFGGGRSPRATIRS